MTLGVLIPYRPDSPHRERIYQTTRRMWEQVEPELEVIYADDGLNGELFSYARAANRARVATDAACLLTYSVDALPPTAQALVEVHAALTDGAPWSVMFGGQQRFTPEQTDRLIAGEDPANVGPARGQICPGREALLAIRAEVWDDLRGYDERFIGWGPEDVAFHRVLQMLYPAGCDRPEYGLFQSLWHPDAPRTAWDANVALWRRYERKTSAAAMRHWYVGRP